MVGGGTLFIADQQRRIAKRQKTIAEEKIVTDLFDRRFEVYEAFHAAIAHAVFSDKLDAEFPVKIERMRASSEQARFIFERECANKILEIRHKVIKSFALSRSLRAYEPAILSHQAAIDQSKLAKEASELDFELLDILDKKLSVLFEPALRLRDFRDERF
ncbi:hypothetical protein AA103193_1921 [Tanticharoenia sakaeratensis NBRC 103193]|nr:hypothetical protein AA103193_1921 [Tanticharoenia sakaeratensis NBRC 103193]